MKVLKLGTIKSIEEWSAKVDCQSCNAELEVKATDLVKAIWYGTHFEHYYTAIQCPLCDALVQVTEVPPPIDKTVTKRVDTGIDHSIY